MRQDGPFPRFSFADQKQAAPMPYGDYDVDSLAAYLHLTPQQVTRLAERGKLPGRKVAGQWRFAKPDIHEWFETQIGLSSEDELLEVEDVLNRAAPAHEKQAIRLADLLPPEAIAVPLPARTRNSVIEVMVEVAARTGWLWDEKAMAEAVRAREDMQPTALENGVALLHPRRPMAKILARPFLALGCTTTGIPFGAGVPLTDVFFLVCSMEDRGHLRVLARLSRLLAAPGFLNALHQAPDAEAARQAVIDFESDL
jgi:PTS system nitrogen regulatory IIA component